MDTKLKPSIVFLFVAVFNLIIGLGMLRHTLFAFNLLLVPVFLYLAATWKEKK